MNDSLRQTGIIVQGSIPWGTHLCLFYETKQDLLDTMVPYFRAGLENKEFCLWILQPSITRQDALEALRRGIPDFDRYLSKGAIELIPQDEWYTEHGKFELAAVVQRFREQLEQATSNGYVGLRANGSSAWLQRTDLTTFGEYEKRLDDAIADTKMIVVCSFSLQDSNSALVFDAARAHQLTAVLRHGSWEVIETHEAGRPNSSKQDFKVVGAAMHRSAKLATLTPREQAVLARIVTGASSKETAQRLGISPRTVEFHRANILQKLGAKNTADLVRIVLAE
ncbi:MAG TPA: MEDS domain-containing protein [Xanthobacteraceae bacterium]|nr:MEDS domain-containing protein [Xanthobacteraceae bacterium]